MKEEWKCCVSLANCNIWWTTKFFLNGYAIYFMCIQSEQGTSFLCSWFIDDFDNFTQIKRIVVWKHFSIPSLPRQKEVYSVVSGSEPHSRSVSRLEPGTEISHTCCQTQCDAGRHHPSMSWGQIEEIYMDIFFCWIWLSTCPPRRWPQTQFLSQILMRRNYSIPVIWSTQMSWSTIHVLPRDESDPKVYYIGLCSSQY